MMTESLCPITRRYLICLNVKCYRDSLGRRYFESLWYKDLIEHVRYLKDLTIACPCETGQPPPDAMVWDPSLPNIHFADLPVANSTGRAIIQLPLTAAKLWRSIGHADIVHLGVAGWPIPFGWLGSPIAILRGKPYVVVVESAPWRLRPGLAVTLKTRLRERVSETLSRWCVNQAKLVIFTQEEYRKSLLTKHPDRGHVLHASWLDEANLISPAAAAEMWRRKKPAPGGTLRLLFAGRLERSKGIAQLLDAMRIASARRLAVQLDILGQGPLLDECEQARRSLDPDRIRILGTLPYGEKFFRTVRQYHAVVVPSLSDEQPRIVYDAYSQAVPILANDTPGLRACVRHCETGMIAGSIEPSSWADIFLWCSQHGEELERMGTEGLEMARRTTHTEMHRKRWMLLLETFGCEERARTG